MERTTPAAIHETVVRTMKTKTVPLHFNPIASGVRGLTFSALEIGASSCRLLRFVLTKYGVFVPPALRALLTALVLIAALAGSTLELIYAADEAPLGFDLRTPWTTSL